MRISDWSSDVFSSDLAGHSQLVFFGKLIHAQNGDDVLKRLVALKDFLNLTRRVVMLLADDARLQNSAGAVERVHSGINALFRNRAIEHRRRVQVSEGGGRRRVGQVRSEEHTSEIQSLMRNSDA